MKKLRLLCMVIVLTPGLISLCFPTSDVSGNSLTAVASIDFGLDWDGITETYGVVSDIVDGNIDSYYKIHGESELGWYAFKQIDATATAEVTFERAYLRQLFVRFTIDPWADTEENCGYDINAYDGEDLIWTYADETGGYGDDRCKELSVAGTFMIGGYADKVEVVANGDAKEDEKKWDNQAELTFRFYEISPVIDTDLVHSYFWRDHDRATANGAMSSIVDKDFETAYEIHGVSKVGIAAARQLEGIATAEIMFERTYIEYLTAKFTIDPWADTGENCDYHIYVYDGAGDPIWAKEDNKSGSNGGRCGELAVDEAFAIGEYADKVLIVAHGLATEDELKIDNQAELTFRFYEILLQSTAGIDIRPKTSLNQIYIASPGDVPVGILSSTDFSAPVRINRDTLTFGRTGGEPSLIRVPPTGKLACFPRDLNSDGLVDLLCSFEILKTGFICGDTQGVLKGETADGISFWGTDSVVILPCAP